MNYGNIAVNVGFLNVKIHWSCRPYEYAQPYLVESMKKLTKNPRGIYNNF